MGNVLNVDQQPSAEGTAPPATVQQTAPPDPSDCSVWCVTSDPKKDDMPGQQMAIGIAVERMKRLYSSLISVKEYPTSNGSRFPNTPEQQKDGMTLDDYPRQHVENIQNAIKTAETTRRPGIIVIASACRFSRCKISGKMLLQKCLNSGVTVYSAAEEETISGVYLNSRDHFNEFVKALEVAQSAFEKIQAKNRIRARNASASQHRYAGAPYGWMAGPEGTTVPNPDQQDVIEGLVTAFKQSGGKFTSVSRMVGWTPQRVSRVLTNDVFQAITYHDDIKDPAKMRRLLRGIYGNTQGAVRLIDRAMAQKVLDLSKVKASQKKIRDEDKRIQGAMAATMSQMTL